MKETKVTLYTHPSRHINTHFADAYPYRRVAGMHVEGETMWAKQRLLTSENSYNPTDTDDQTLVLPHRLAMNVATYFKTFYADHSAPYRLDDTFAHRATGSNCFRFAASMHTGQLQGFYESYSITSTAIEQRASSAPARVGDIAIVGTNGPNIFDFSGAHTVHASVRLGSAAPQPQLDSLEVIAIDGNMAISNSSYHEPKYSHLHTGGSALETYYLGRDQQLEIDYGIGDRFKRILAD